MFSKKHICYVNMFAILIVEMIKNGLICSTSKRSFPGAKG